MSRDGLIFVCLFQIYFRILSKLTQLTGSALFDEGAHSNLDHEGAHWRNEREFCVYNCL